MSKPTLPPRHTGLIVIESAASLMLIFLAVVGNALILAALYRNPRLRNTTNIYIAALAVTDLLNACIPGTLFSSSIITGRLIFSKFGCQLSGFLLHFLTYASMATMVLTAVNRYYRVVKPQHYNKVFSYKRSLSILVGLWFLVAAFVLSPLAFSLAEFTFTPVMACCAYKFATRGTETVFSAIVVGVFVFFGFSLISVSYYRVSRVLIRHKTTVSHSLRGVSAREINLTNVLFALVLAFAVCWLPTFGVILIIRLLLGGRASHSLGVITPFLLQTCGAVNPLIYGAMSPSFRREFRQLLLFKRADQSSAADEPRGSHMASPRSQVPAVICHDNALASTVESEIENIRHCSTLVVCEI